MEVYQLLTSIKYSWRCSAKIPRWVLQAEFDRIRLAFPTAVWGWQSVQPGKDPPQKTTSFSLQPPISPHSTRNCFNPNHPSFSRRHPNPVDFLVPKNIASTCRPAMNPSIRSAAWWPDISTEPLHTLNHTHIFKTQTQIHAYTHHIRKSMYTRISHTINKYIYIYIYICYT